MAEISEAIAMIKKAEDEADQLVLDADFKSKEMIDNSRQDAEANLSKAKNEATQEAKKTIFDAEDKAKNKAKSITAESEGSINSLKNKAMANIDEAASIIVRHIL